jgi:hypothetical protein
MENPAALTHACKWRQITLNFLGFSGTSRGRRAGGVKALIAKKETSALSSRSKLQSRQLRVHTCANDEFVMLTNFHNTPFVEHDDAVGFLDRG